MNAVMPHNKPVQAQWSQRFALRPLRLTLLVTHTLMSLSPFSINCFAGMFGVIDFEAGNINSP